MVSRLMKTRACLRPPQFQTKNYELFSMNVDIDKINSHSRTPGRPSLKPPPGIQPSQPLHVRRVSVDNVIGNVKITSSVRHQHSNSMDGSLALVKQEHLVSDVYEIKKAMPAEKLAELAWINPKRAKRILANRQSAARSKERKMCYISELERKVQTLQIEATTLSAQLTILKRETAGLTLENNELKVRLHSMEQQAQLRDAINDALRDEVQHLKLVTGQFTPSNKHMAFFQCMQPAILSNQSERGPHHEGCHLKGYASMSFIQQEQQQLGSVSNNSAVSQEGMQTPGIILTI